MLQYILIRHGESTANKDETVRQYTAECDIPLTVEGIAQSVEVAKRIQPLVQTSPITVILSPYLRAKQTFHHINQQLQANISEISEDVRLRELDYGKLHARTDEQHDECKREIVRKGSVYYYQYPDGESYTTLQTRLATLNNEILGEWRERDYPDQIILMIAHAHVLAAWDVLLMKKDIKEVNYKMSNCQVKHYYKEKGIIEHFLFYIPSILVEKTRETIPSV